MRACTSWKLRRILVGATQQEIAHRAGISQRWLRGLENGMASPTDEEARSLGRLLGDLAARLSRKRQAMT